MRNVWWFLIRVCRISPAAILKTDQRQHEIEPNAESRWNGKHFHYLHGIAQGNLASLLIIIYRCVTNINLIKSHSFFFSPRWRESAFIKHEHSFPQYRNIVKIENSWWLCKKRKSPTEKQKKNGFSDVHFIACIDKQSELITIAPLKFRVFVDRLGGERERTSEQDRFADRWKIACWCVLSKNHSPLSIDCRRQFKKTLGGVVCNLTRKRSTRWSHKTTTPHTKRTYGWAQL